MAKMPGPWTNPSLTFFPSYIEPASSPGSNHFLFHGAHSRLLAARQTKRKIVQRKPKILFSFKMNNANNGKAKKEVEGNQVNLSASTVT